MRNLVGHMFLVCLLLMSCGKSDSTGCQPQSVDAEKAQLIAYANKNNINYEVHPSGFLYEIVSPGAGAIPKASSVITVTYVGKHLDNTVFDTAYQPFTSSLNNLIDGWRMGIPLIKNGGRLKLILPSALAYSCLGSRDQTTGGYVIQPNEPIYFDLTLQNVQ